MAAITITIPNALLPRVLDAFAATYGYSDTIPDPDKPDAKIPNPETSAAFAQRQVIAYIKETVATYEGRTATKTATAKARADLTLT